MEKGEREREREREGGGKERVRNKKSHIRWSFSISCNCSALSREGISWSSFSVEVTIAWASFSLLLASKLWTILFSSCNTERQVFLTEWPWHSTMYHKYRERLSTVTNTHALFRYNVSKPSNKSNSSCKMWRNCSQTLIKLLWNLYVCSIIQYVSEKCHQIMYFGTCKIWNV